MSDEQRAALVRDLIEYRRPPAAILAELALLGWDCDRAVAELGVVDLRRILGGFVNGELSAGEVGAWADAVEVRDDLDFESESVKEAVHALANPLLQGELDVTRAGEISRSVVGRRHACACCGYLTMDSPAGDGSYDICPVCFWEDDGVQWRDPAYGGGANSPSLMQARRNFEVLGASDAELVNLVRTPRPTEKPRDVWSDA